jgi:hypothetical protein
MADNVLQEIEQALDQLSSLLDQDPVKQALDLIPDNLKDPVVDGLKTVLNVIKDALNELKENLDSVLNLDELFSTINGLLEAVEGLAPGEKETLETVRSIVQTLQGLPGVEDINRILQKVDQIVAKLEAL